MKKLTAKQVKAEEMMDRITEILDEYVDLFKVQDFVDILFSFIAIKTYASAPSKKEAREYLIESLKQIVIKIEMHMQEGKEVYFERDLR